jgi:hypothetical protein
MTALPALGQETATPDPASESVLLLPHAAAFGPESMHLKMMSVDKLSWAMTMAPDVFREGAVGIYGGPTRAQVVVATLLLTNARIALRRGANATRLFHSYGYQLDDEFNQTGLWDAPLSAGCAEAKRFEGVSRDFGFPTGVTLCAADPDLIVVAVASGLVNDRAGEAADAVVKAVIDGRG